MKYAIAAAFLAISTSIVMAEQPHQGPDIEAQKTALKRLCAMTGEWEGEGWVMNGPQRFEYRQTEDVRFNLDGGIIMIDGRGYAPQAPDSAPPIFSAFAVLSYDDRAEAYELRSYSRGYAGNFSAQFLDDGRFEWIAGPVRYRIDLSEDGKWIETGERKMGDEWTEFLGMALTRTSPSACAN